MIKRIFLCIVISVCSFFITNVSAQTLREAVQQAMAIHPEIMLNRAQTSSAEQAISEAKSAHYPKIDINSAYGSEWTQSPFTKDLVGDNSTSLKRREFNVALVQNIFAGGAISGEVDRNVFLFKSQDYKTLSVMNDIVLDVTQAYLDVLLQNELVNIAQTNLEEHARLLNLIQERSRAGIARTAELDQAESRYSLAQANLISAQGDRREAMVRFRKLVGAWPEHLVNPIIPQKEILPRSVDLAVKESFDNHPRIRVAIENINQAKAQRKISDAAFMPKVDAVLTASRNANLDGVPGPNNDRIGLIRVSYNPFNGGGDLARMRKTAYQVQEAFESRNKTLIDLKEEIQLNYNTWHASTKRTEVLSRYVVTISRTKLAYFEQFKLGQRTFLDLINSQNEVYRSRVDYLQANRDEVRARYKILNSVGRLVPFFAHQSDEKQHAQPLFVLPKVTEKSSPTVQQDSMPLNSLNPKMVYQTGQAMIAPVLNPPKSSTKLKGVYLIDLSGFINLADAQKFAEVLVKKGLSAQVKSMDSEAKINHVVVGPYLSISEADKILDVIPYDKNIARIIRQATTDDNLTQSEHK